jgi:hypothetical protein
MLGENGNGRDPAWRGPMLNCEKGHSAAQSLRGERRCLSEGLRACAAQDDESPHANDDLPCRTNNRP